MLLKLVELMNFFLFLSSQQLAQEVLKSPSEDEDEEKKEGGSGSGFEGMDALAKAIETG